MEIAKFLSLMGAAEQLKNNTRHSFTSTGRPESVAEHSWRLCFMAFFLKDEFPQADMDKVIRMCVFHDMGEAFTGDIPAFEKGQADELVEEDAIANWLSTLPDAYREELSELFAEMKALDTLEAKIYKALDKMEAVIQHNEADISTWLPLEFDLQLIYGEKEVQFSSYTKALKEAINAETKEKILREKK